VYVDLARVQILAGQYEAAQTSASNALLLNPENPAAYAVLGWSLTFIGDPLEAEANLLRALELDPDNPEAQAYYAELLTDQGDYEAAGVYSRRALELAPDSLAAHRSRGYVLWLTGNYEEAVVEYQRAIDINDSIADLHLSLGRVYWNLELFQEAIDEFSLADALNPSDPLPDTYISQIYLYLGEFAKAIQFAQRALEEDPTNPRRYGNLGVAYYRNLQYQDAIDVFTFAVHGGITADNRTVVGLPLDYDVDHYFYMYGLSLARARRCTEAIPIFQALLAAVPGDEIAVFNANEGINICESYLNEPTPTATVGEGTLLPTQTIGTAPATGTP
jgi:tetratricopeptide (TPR) repeat protein